MASAVGFTKPLVGGVQLRATRTASPVVEFVKTYNPRKCVLLALFQQAHMLPEYGMGLSALIGNGIGFAYTDRSLRRRQAHQRAHS
jgi:hypothetical protein